MLAVLIEHTGGKWPFWLSPRQACVVPVGQGFIKYATEVSEILKQAGFYADVDDSNKQLNNKIRECFVEAWNYIVVVGHKVMQHAHHFARHASDSCVVCCDYDRKRKV